MSVGALGADRDTVTSTPEEAQGEEGLGACEHMRALRVGAEGEELMPASRSAWWNRLGWLGGCWL